ncbi:MAG TPA: hypothetical protein EYF95_08330 [Flavobacteriales bacterium]|jgi:hypothetical protein|nr:hypothetical protein [Flavobacteriales bacterium]
MSKQTFPRLFNVFGTSFDLDGKRAMRRLAIVLGDALGKSVHISNNKQVGETVVKGKPVKVPGWAVLVGCDSKAEAKELRNKFWNPAVFVEVSPFRVAKLPQHAKNLEFDANAKDFNPYGWILAEFGLSNMDFVVKQELYTSEKVLTKPKGKPNVKESKASDDGELVNIKAA